MYLIVIYIIANPKKYLLLDITSLHNTSNILAYSYSYQLQKLTKNTMTTALQHSIASAEDAVVEGVGNFLVKTSAM